MSAQLLSLQFEVFKAQIISAMIVAERTYERWPAGTIKDGENVGGKFKETGESDGSSAKSKSSQSDAGIGGGIVSAFKGITDALPKFGSKTPSPKVRENAGTTVKTLGTHYEKNVPEQGRNAFNDVLASAAGAVQKGFDVAMKAAMDAGEKALDYAKDHPVETTVGIVAAVGLVATGISVVGTMAAADALEAGVAEFALAEEGTELSEAAAEVAKIAKSIRQPLLEIQEKIASGEISLLDIGLQEGEEFVVASEKEIAQMLNIKKFAVTTAAVRGVVNTVFTTYVTGMAALISKQMGELGKANQESRDALLEATKQTKSLKPML